MSLQVRKQHHKQSQLTSVREEQNKMKVTRLRQKATDKYITEVIEYSSLSEFYDYIMNTPYNKTFEHRSHSSETGSREFTKTYSFDELCIQLLEMQKSADIKELKESTYYYVFYDFDGSTGCDIPQRLTDYDYKYLLNIAQHVYKLYEQETQNKNKKEKIK